MTIVYAAFAVIVLVFAFVLRGMRFALATLLALALLYVGLVTLITGSM